MKHIFTLFIGFFAFVLLMNAQIFQSNFENWTAGNPDGWVGIKTNIESDSIIQITTGATYGSNACKLVNTESTHKRLTTQPLSVTAGEAYEIKFWVKGKGNIRTALYDVDYGNYNAYINVDAATWTQYSQTVTAAASSSSAEFIISVQSTVAANDHLQLDSVAIVPTTVNFVSIYDIQGQAATSPYNGQVVKTRGVVTALHYDFEGGTYKGYFIQDGAGQWNGMYVYSTTVTPAIGDSVSVTATVTEFSGLTELTSVTSVILNSGNVLPSPTSITTGTMAEGYESVLISLSNAQCTDANAGYGIWIVNDGSGALGVDDDIFAYTPILNEYYSITGIGHYSFSEYKILPRSVADVILGINDINKNNLIKLYPNPSVDGVFFIEGAIINVSITDAQGKFLFNTSNKIDLSNYSKGVYIAKIQTENGIVLEKIVIE
ncbi:MAG: T9SS type A sorting domain-containing protein [Bacteroidota bacterium]